MKFKITSILELIIPLSVALLLSAFLGCGGGSSSYGGSQRYDGAWTAKFWTDTLFTAAASAPGGKVVCNDPALPYVPLTIAYGYGKTTWSSSCLGVATYADPTGGTSSNWDWVITVDINASGVVTASVNGNLAGSGTCQDLYTCSAIIGKAPLAMTRPAY